MSIMNINRFCIYLLLTILSGTIPVISHAQSGPTIVRDVAYSPDGNYLAYAVETPECYSGTPQPFLVQIVNLENNQVIQSIGKNEDCPYNTISWSPDGTRIALSSDAGTASVWDVATGSQIALYANSGYGVRSLNNVAWSPVNDRIAVADTSPFIWDASTGNIIGSAIVDSQSVGIPRALDWSFNGTELAISTPTGYIEIWDMDVTTVPNQWSLIQRLNTGVHSKIAFSPDGLFIAAINEAQIHVFEISSALLAQTLAGASATLTDVQWNSNGSFIAASDVSGQVHIWDVTTQNEITTFNAQLPVWSLDWHPNGNEIVFGGVVEPNNDNLFNIVDVDSVTCDSNVAPSSSSDLIVQIGNANLVGSSQVVCLEGTYNLTVSDNSASDGPNGLPVITSDITLHGLGTGAEISGTLQVSGAGRLTLRNMSVNP